MLENKTKVIAEHHECPICHTPDIFAVSHLATQGLRDLKKLPLDGRTCIGTTVVVLEDIDKAGLMASVAFVRYENCGKCGTHYNNATELIRMQTETVLQLMVMGPATTPILAIPLLNAKILGDHKQCPICKSPEVVSYLATQDLRDAGKIDKAARTSLETIMSPLENVVSAGLMTDAAFSHYDCCANCGFYYETYTELAHLGTDQVKELMGLPTGKQMRRH